MLKCQKPKKLQILLVLIKKMPQSGVGSMQGSNEDCLPMKGHTREGDAPSMLPIEWTQRGAQP